MSGSGSTTTKACACSSKREKAERAERFGYIVKCAAVVSKHSLYLQRLSPVSLSVFSLVRALLFDCLRVLEDAKIRTVLQSISPFACQPASKLSYFGEQSVPRENARARGRGKESLQRLRKASNCHRKRAADQRSADRLSRRNSIKTMFLITEDIIFFPRGHRTSTCPLG